MSDNEQLMPLRSWYNDEQLAEILKSYREGTQLKGIVRSIITKQNHRDVFDGKEDTQTIEGEGPKELKDDIVLVITLSNGKTGYCHTSKYSTHKFANYRTQVGRDAYFFVENVDFDNNILHLDGKRAQEANQRQFLAELKKYEAEGTLKERTYKGVVTGVQADGKGVYALISGYTCFLPRREWSWNVRDAMNVSIGEEISVRIRRVDYRMEVEENSGQQRERVSVYVSRRETLPDPYAFITGLKKNDPVAGKVISIDAQHGTFVQLEVGLDVRASKSSYLEDPAIGDRVACVVTSETIERRNQGRVSGRVMIVGYPNGKRTIQDPGSFLFD